MRQVKTDHQSITNSLSIFSLDIFAMIELVEKLAEGMGFVSGERNKRSLLCDVHNSVYFLSGDAISQQIYLTRY